MVAIHRKDLHFDLPRSEDVTSTAGGGLPFEEIVRTHAPYVWRVLRSLGVPEHDVEDLSQETFLVVHRTLARFEGRSKLRTWIYGIALRVASDYRAKAHRKREVPSELPPETHVAASQEADLAQKQALSQLEAMLAKLPEERRQVFVLYEVEQLTMREVAEIVGCPLTTAYSRYHAARSTIDAELQRGSSHA
jgi:RNA polymerase sigma-70 factor, ECF subfamily